MLLAAATQPVPGTEWGTPEGISLQAGAVALLVLCNAFFVASEFAMVRVRPSQLEPLVEDGDRRAAVAKEITSHLDVYLSATQLGVTLASLGLGWIGEPFMAGLIAPIFHVLGVKSPAIVQGVAFTLGFSVITFAHIVLGEQSPKFLSIRRALPMALRLARPLHFFTVAFRPAIWFLNVATSFVLGRFFGLEPSTDHELAHSEEELRVILTESGEQNEVTPVGKEILMNALDLRQRIVRDITTPRGEVVWLDLDNTFEENLNLALKSRHTRFPLCQGHLDNTVGQVHIKDLLLLTRQPTPNLMAVKRELVPVPEMMRLEKLLTLFLSKHTHLALVVDEYGGTAGIVTLDNVIEELVGAIQDEFDSESPEFRKVSEEEFVVEGTLSLYELNDITGLSLESSDVSTIGGYITHVIGHLPQRGEKTRIDDYEVTITKSDGRRVEQLHLKKAPAATESAQEE